MFKLNRFDNCIFVRMSVKTLKFCKDEKVINHIVHVLSHTSMRN